MSKYVFNQETQKIELHFEKSDYMGLSDDIKKEIKSAFLWSGKAGAWVSRSTKNHYWALRVAEKLGLSNGGKIGERLSYAEELERKSERAEARAERYEGHAENAAQRAKQLQSVFDKHRGDIAFFTQPIIVGHAGSQAFSNYRERLFDRYKKGFEEYRKSAYYQDRAATSRATADNAKLQDRVYLHNRIKEQNKKLRNYQGYIVENENNLYEVQQGKILKKYTGEVVTAENIETSIEDLLEKYDYEQGKLEFFEKCLEDLGGIQFSKENIKVGFVVEVRHSSCEVISAGPANITYKILDGGAKGMVLTAPYAEIVKIIHAKEKRETIANPYQAGDILCKHRSADNTICQAYQVIKTTPTGVRLQQIAIKDGQPVANSFISDKSMQKKVTKSKYSDFVGVYVDDWQLHKYA